jgi:hypothetical protein
MRKNLSWVIPALVVLASRLPFLTPGYGVDPDATSVISAAQRIAETHTYHASRCPCYPVPEIAYAGIQCGGPVACNLVTALLSVAAFLLVVAVFRFYQSPDALLSGFAFAFIPVIYVNSVNSMDYLWAMAFLMGAVYGVLRRRGVLAGVCLGLAIGCRITSGAMILPLLLLWPSNPDKKSYGAMIRFAAVALATAAILFLPPFWQCGFGFFAFYENGYPAWRDVVRRAVVEVWGPVGTVTILVVLLIAGCGIVLRKPRTVPSIPPNAASARQIGGWALAVGLYLAAFLRLPHEAGYLIPATPFVLLLLARWLPRRFFQAICLVLMISPFVGFSEKKGLTEGAILADHRLRRAVEDEIDGILRRTEQLPPRSLVVAGPSQTRLLIKASPETRRRVEFADLIDRKSLNQYLAQGYTLYYLSTLREENLQARGLDLQKAGGIAIPVTDQQQP